MLADALDGARTRVVDECERRARVTEPFGQAAVRRRGRLDALVGDLITTLRSGGVSSQAPAVPMTLDPELDHSERTLVLSDVIEQIERHELEASPPEIRVASEWAAEFDARYWHERSRQLSLLVDGVEECATVLAADGRILFLNRRATQVLHEICGVAPDEIVGKTFAQVGATTALGLGRSSEGLLELAREREPFEVEARGRTRRNQLSALYGPDGATTAVALVSHDIHSRRLAEKRMEPLTRLSVLVGTLDYDEVAEALAQVPIPEVADWCAVNIIRSRKVQYTAVAHRNPAKAHVRDAFVRAVPNWDRHPLWQEMLTGGFQLLSEVTDDLLHKLTVNDEQYQALSQTGIRSLMVVPLVTRGEIRASSPSATRQSQDDGMAGTTFRWLRKFAVHAAHIVENARLLKDLPVERGPLPGRTRRRPDARIRAGPLAEIRLVLQSDASGIEFRGQDRRGGIRAHRWRPSPRRKEPCSRNRREYLRQARLCIAERRTSSLSKDCRAAARRQRENCGSDRRRHGHHGAAAHTAAAQGVPRVP